MMERRAIGKVQGASPSTDLYYLLILFDISDSKKYRILIKLLNQYGTRIQKSVFEAWLRASQIKDLAAAIERLMSSKRFFNENDAVRLYRIGGNCQLMAFGELREHNAEENIFF